MNLQLADKIAGAVLYEGYILYPYRASSVKNRQRFNFGVLAPPDSERAQDWQMQTECLVHGDERTTMEVRLRFLHLALREAREMAADETNDWRAVESIEVDGRLYQTWQEAIEREVVAEEISFSELIAQSRRRAFSFPALREIEALSNDAAFVREQPAINGEFEIAAEQMTERLFKISVRIRNLTPIGVKPQSRDEARNQELLRSLVSTHTLIGASNGEFVSLLDPPEEFRAAAAACHNLGAWPVLVGAEGERDLMLSSPIILYDYPRIAPESAGDFFDGAEIDEMLTLRVLTLTDAEKREMSSIDDLARRILERTEALPAEQMMKLHGAMQESVRTFNHNE